MTWEKMFPPLPRVISILLMGIFIFTLFTLQLAIAADDEPNKPWQVSADSLEYLDEKNVYVAEGNVILQKGNRKITADKVSFDSRYKSAWAEGNVLIEDGQNTLEAERIEIDLDSQIGSVHMGHLFTQDGNFHIRGDWMEKIGAAIYKSRRAAFTTCDNTETVPPWRITGHNVTVDLEGYATGWHGILWLWRLPVLYSPYVTVPVMQERQTGLLMPRLTLSERNGFAYEQPFFWAISDSTDATFYWDHIAERGEKLGAEYRYVFNQDSFGAIMYDYLDDKQKEDGDTDTIEEWGFDHDNIERTNTERYWFRFKHSQGRMPLGLTAKLDLDIVSDQDYLIEFRRGINGFNETEDYFVETFGRDLDEDDDPIRTNSFNLNRRWSKHNFNFSTYWFDDVVRRQNDALDFTIQQLPQIEFTSSKQQIVALPLYYSLNSEYVHYWRQDGDENHNATAVQRVDVAPRLYLPLQFRNWFTIEPAAGFRYNYWDISQMEDPSALEKTSFDRGIYDFDITFGSSIYNIFDVAGTRIDKIKHAIIPEIDYTYTPDKNQDEFPNEIGFFTIQPRNFVNYSLTQYFTSRLLPTLKNRYQTQVTGETQAEATDPDDINYDYHEFLRIKFAQSYDFDIADDDDPDAEPFSPLFGEIRLKPTDNFSLIASINWDTYENEEVDHAVTLFAEDDRGDALYVRHRYQRDSLETLNLGVKVAITDSLTTYLNYEQDIEESEMVLLGAGFTYTAQCWSIGLQYLDENDDQRYTVVVGLYGLGEYSQGVDP